MPVQGRGCFAVPTSARRAATYAMRPSPTFRNQRVQTPLHSHHIVTGAHCEVLTNSPAILEATRKFFRYEVAPQKLPTMTLRLWVDPAARDCPPCPQPFFRGLGHLTYAAFDSENSLLIDLRRRRVLGRFSGSMAVDAGYWQRVILPALVGLASDALGVTVIHSACMERDGDGLLLAGESGAGKSTLSLAMAHAGFHFLSDDWTYLSHARRKLTAWGLVTPLKLLPESADFFPELRRLQPGVSLNGETAFEVDPEAVFGVRRSLRCDPRWLVFLERHSGPGHAFSRMPLQEAARSLGSAQGRLPRELSKLRKTQRATIQSLVERECWLLRYSEPPEVMARVLSEFCGASRPPDRECLVAGSRPLFWRSGPDPTKRLTTTPLAAELCAAGCAVRLETNNAAILWLVASCLRPRSQYHPVHTRFLWRLVSDDDAGIHGSAESFSGASADGLQFINMGQRGFMAMDAAARCAVGFLSKELLNDVDRFRNLVLARLIMLTETALRSRPHLPRRQEGRPLRLERVTP